MAHRRRQRELGARHPEAGDRPKRDVREIRVVSERLARRDVRQMHLDERNLCGQQRVAQRDTRMRERRRIEQNGGDSLIAGSMDSLNQLGLGIALERLELVTGRRRLRERLIDVLQVQEDVNARAAD